VSGTELARFSVEALYVALLVSAPALLVSLAVGLVVGIAQAVTQVQEQTLSFVPKLVGVGVVLAVLGGWMGSELVRFTQSLFVAIAGTP
jgi:flagellar biosynthetic protein FliQ